MQSQHKAYKISIITVCWNAERDIEKTINSVITQDYQNIEYVVIDGASTDGTLEIIEKYKDKIDILVSEKDQGIYDAMNKGLNLASGDYIHFLNAGEEFIAKDRLTQIVGQLNEEEMIIGNCYVMNQRGELVFLKKHDWINKKGRVIRETINHQSVLVRRDSLIKHGGFDLKYKVAADYDLILKILFGSRKPAKYIDLPITNFVFGGVSTSQDSDEITKINAEFLEIRRKYYPWLERGWYITLLRILYLAIWLPIRKILSSTNYLTSLIVLKSRLLSNLIPTNNDVVLVIAEMDKFGGTRSYFLHLIDLLLDANKIVVVMLEEDRLKDEGLIEKLNNNSVVLRKIPNNGRLMKFLGIYSIYFRVVASYYAFFYTVLKYRPATTIVSVGTSGKYLHTALYSSNWSYVMHTRPQSLNRWDQRILHKSLGSKNKRIVVPSHFAAGELASIWDLERRNIVSLYNSVQKVEKGHRALSVKKEVKVLSLGHVEDYKRPDLAIKLLEQLSESLPGFEVSLTWGGGGSLLDFYRFKTSNSKNIKFIGPVSHEEALQLISECNLYMQVSEKETFGIATAEAMSAGIPCIVTKDTALEEITNSGECGVVVDPLNLQRAVKEIVELVVNNKIYSRKSEKGKAIYNMRYTVEMWRSEMLKIISNNS